MTTVAALNCATNHVAACFAATTTHYIIVRVKTWRIIRTRGGRWVSRVSWVSHAAILANMNIRTPVMMFYHASTLCMADRTSSHDIKIKIF
jgi:putative flippase GtrA